MGTPRRAGGEMRWIGARPTRTATGLLVAVGAAFLVLLFLDGAKTEWVRQYFALTPKQALGPRPWQLVTSWLVQDPRQFGSTLSDLFGIWVFVTAVELRMGGRRTLALFAAAQLFGALVMAAAGRLLGIDAQMVGAGPAVVAMVTAFGLLYRDLPIRLFGIAEMKAYTLAGLVVGLGLVVAVLNRSWLVVLGDAAGILAGWAVIGGGLSRIEHGYQRWRLRRLRRRYRVIPGGRSSSIHRNYIN